MPLCLFWKVVIFFSVLLEKSYQNKIFSKSLFSDEPFFTFHNATIKQVKSVYAVSFGEVEKCPPKCFFAKVAQVSWASLNFWHASLMRQPVMGCSGKNVNRISNSLLDEIPKCLPRKIFIWSDLMYISKLITSSKNNAHFQEI